MTWTGAWPVFIRSWLCPSDVQKAAMLGFSFRRRSCPFCQSTSFAPSMRAAIVMMWDGSKSGMESFPTRAGLQRSAQLVSSPFTMSGR